MPSDVSDVFGNYFSQREKRHPALLPKTQGQRKQLQGHGFGKPNSLLEAFVSESQI